MSQAWVVVLYTLGFVFPSLKWANMAAATTAEETKTICKGDNIVLNEPNPEVTAHHIFVYRNGETVASTSVDATGDLQRRLLLETDSKVTLTNVSSRDFGEYRVEVKLSDGKATEHSVRLVVGESPQTTDGNLFAMSNVSNPLFIRLKCGTFTSLGYPPVSVLWQDPSGQFLASTGFSDQSFTLDLLVKVAKSGSYCCRIDCRYPKYCCLHDQSPLRQCANLDVQMERKTTEVEIARQVGVPLENFINLAQQVSAIDVVVRELNFSSISQRVADIDVIVRDLQRARTDQDCSESGVSAIAHLVHRQAKCDQLDAYIDRVNASEQKFGRELGDVTRITTDIEARLNSVLKATQDIHLQVQDDMLTMNKSIYDYIFQATNDAIDLNVTLRHALSELSKVDDIMSADPRMANSPDYHNQVTKDLTAVSQNLSDLRTNTGQDISTVMNKVAEIEKTSDSQGQSLNETLNSLHLLVEESMTTNVSLQHALSKLQQTDEWIANSAERLSDLSDRLKTVEGHHDEIKSNLTVIAEDVKDFMGDKLHKMSELKSKVENLENTLRTHVSELQETVYGLKVGCPMRNGYAVFGTHCLKMYTMVASYIIARRRCQEDGTHLFHFKSRDLDTRPFLSLMEKNRMEAPQHFWVGADDILTEGRFLWSDGSALPAYSEVWDSEEPDNYENQDCVQLKYSEKNIILWFHDEELNLYDTYCAYSYKFICQL